MLSVDDRSLSNYVFRLKFVSGFLKVVYSRRLDTWPHPTNTWDWKTIDLRWTVSRTCISRTNVKEWKELRGSELRTEPILTLRWYQNTYCSEGPGDSVTTNNRCTVIKIGIPSFYWTLRVNMEHCSQEQPIPYVEGPVRKWTWMRVVR